MFYSVFGWRSAGRQAGLVAYVRTHSKKDGFSQRNNSKSMLKTEQRHSNVF
jgi:hypothetical protein